MRCSLLLTPRLSVVAPGCCSLPLPNVMPHQGPRHRRILHLEAGSECRRRCCQGCLGRQGCQGIDHKSRWISGSFVARSEMAILPLLYLCNSAVPKLSGRRLCPQPQRGLQAPCQISAGASSRQRGKAPSQRRLPNWTSRTQGGSAKPLSLESQRMVSNSISEFGRIGPSTRSFVEKELCSP